MQGDRGSIRHYQSLHDHIAGVLVRLLSPGDRLVLCRCLDFLCTVTPSRHTSFPARDVTDAIRHLTKAVRLLHDEMGVR